jgi:hypothetical protein
MDHREATTPHSVQRQVPSEVPGAALAGLPGAVASSSRWVRMRGPLLTAGLAGGLALALHVRDPHSSGSWGLCPWLALTGHYCPGCGSLRAVNDLTNADLAAAASSNFVFVAMVPVLVFWWLRWTGRSWSGTPGPVAVRQRSGLWIALGAVVMVAFGVLRNLPAGSWLAP